MERPGSSLLELRLRLYRPDPPADAVEAYLAALAEVVPPESATPPRAVRPRRPVLGPAAVTVALIAVAAAGLGMARQAASAAPDVPAVASHLELPPVSGRPIGELYGGPATTGLFDAHGVRAVVSVFCSGDGTIRLTIGPEAPLELTCEVGGPALAMFESAEDLGAFTVAVAPQPGVRWSLQAGATSAP